MTHSRHFKLFLWIYTLALLFHVFTMEWSFSVGIGLSIGFIVATIAHLSHGYWTLGLLMIHMGIEWSQHISYGEYYSRGDITLNAIHALLDFVFIWQEAKAHVPKYEKYITWGVPMVILIAFILSRLSGIELPLNSHEEGESILETLVIGGILGCTFSHLFSEKKESN